MDKLLKLSILLTALALGACGGSGDCGGTVIGGECDATATTQNDPNDPVAQTITISSDLPNLLSDRTGGSSVTVTAFVLDENDALMESELVSFSAPTGSTSGSQLTDAGGRATAQVFASDDVTNRTLTVTATAQSSGITASVDIQVVGTVLSLQGPSAVSTGDDATFNIVLTDGRGNGVPAQTITMASVNGNSFDDALPETSLNGEVTVTLTADGTNTAIDSVTAQALGETATSALTVTNDVFSFTAPVANTEVPLGAPGQLLEITWQQGGNVPDGSQIDLAIDRGSLSAGSVTTTGGIATVTVSSPFSGLATIQATGKTLGATPILVADQPTTSIPVEFIATVPQTILLLAFPDTVVEGEQAPIIATVKDAAGNTVKNATVSFNIVSDPSGGVLSVPSDITDSQGVARSFYTAGNTSTQKDGVQISATTAGISEVVNLTVAGQAVDFVMGSGKDLFEISNTRFGMPWSITVTDVTGAPQVGAQLRIGVRSTDFGKGQWLKAMDTLTGEILWAQFPSDWCADEDLNENGSIDLLTPGACGTGEDVNTNCSLDAGNVATIVPTTCDLVVPGVSGTSQQTMVTDGAGAVELCVLYPQDHNTWVDVRLSATAPVDGTENTESRRFRLPGLAEDFNNLQEDPPGQVSPFGVNLCSDND